MKNRKRKGKSLLSKWGIPVIIGAIVNYFLVSVLALILTKKDIKTELLPYILIVFGAAACGLCAFICAKNNDLQGIISGAVSALIYSVLIIGVYCFLCGMQVNHKLIVMLPVNLIAGIICGIIAKNIH